MDRLDKTANRSALVCEWACMALLVATVVTCMLLGSGVSTTARSLFQILSILCVVAGLLAMSFDGRYRILRSPLLLLVAAVPGLALIQILPGPWADFAPLRWSHHENSAVISTDRNATMQWFLWSIAVLGLLWVASHTLRTSQRVLNVAVSLAIAVAISGAVGSVLSLQKSKNVFGIFRVDDPKSPMLIRDSFRTENAIGITNVRWTEMEERSATNPWFRQEASEAHFAGFWSVAHWAACTIALLPIVLTQALRLLRRPPTEKKEFELFGLPVLAQGYGLTAIVVAMTAILGWWADPVNATLALAVVTVATLMLCHRDDRAFLTSVGILQLAIVVVLAVVRIQWDGGFHWLGERGRQFLADNASLARAFADHLWFGCGLGSIAEVWPMYRRDPSSVMSQGSSVLMILVETGLLGALLVATGSIYTLGRWNTIRDRLKKEDRQLLASLFAGLTGMVAFGMLGPGLETPVVMTLFIVLTGCVARGLVGGFSSIKVGGIHP